jgi:hypothetical protein
MEKLACLLSSPSGLVVTLGYGRLELAPYAKGMAYDGSTVLAMVAQWEW